MVTIKIDNNKVMFEEGMSLDSFMTANKLTAYSVAKTLLKDAKRHYANIVNNDIADSPDAALVAGKVSAKWDNKDKCMKIKQSLSYESRAVEGNILHENAVKRYQQKQAERSAKIQAQADAFRSACKAKWEADRSKRIEAETARLEKEKADAEIASKLAAEMA